MTALIKTFVASESGAVTVDWVVLTAAMVGLGIATVTVVSNGLEMLAGRIDHELFHTAPNTNPFATNGAFNATRD
jgi:Flp pilus assembly pilin Flp